MTKKEYLEMDATAYDDRCKKDCSFKARQTRELQQVGSSYGTIRPTMISVCVHDLRCAILATACPR
eukprot:803457-Pleurochrysis_carterae.AAC.1